MLNELNNHKIWRRLLHALKTHPYKDEVSALHVSAIVKGGKILSICFNSPKENAFIRRYRYHDACNIHSECAAILLARKKTDLRGAKIYSARIRKKDHKIASASPCPMCWKVIEAHGIKRIYFTTALGYRKVSIHEKEEAIKKYKKAAKSIS